jgi:hypothetical protein
VLRFEQVITPRFIGSCLLTTTVAASMTVQAQVAENVVSVDDGTEVRSIARLVGDRWLDDTKCAANLNPSASDRLRVSGSLKQFPVRAVVPGSQEWLRLSPTIVELFERRERDQRLLSDRTSDSPRAVDWIYATNVGERRTYYFEASRRVTSASADVDHDIDPPGTLRIAVAGFLLDAPDRLAPVGTKSELRWEQDGLPAGPTRPDLTPLGVVVSGDKSLWLMRGQSGTSRWFTLYEVGATGTSTALTVRPRRC